jgi:GNAT superfamily N-acetyltransferase
MSSDIHIRQARAGDLETIVDANIKLAWETEKLTLDRATVTEGTRNALADPSKGLYFLAEIDCRVVGQLMLTHEWSDWRNGDIWWIQSVYVDADHRGKGVFTGIYGHVEQLARQQGIAGIRLYVERDNAAAAKTYTRLGMITKHYDVMELMFRGLT